MRYWVMRPQAKTALCLVTAAALVPIAAAGAAKPPKPGKLTLKSSAKVITFGQKDTLSGQLQGAGAAGVTVDLQQEPAPFTGGFKNVSGASVTTDSTGKFSFTVQPGLTTRYRAVAKASPPVTSPELTLPVRFKVTLRLSDYTPKRGQRVRFSGINAPAHDGALVYIQRRTSTGSWRTVKRTTLHHATTGDRSTYSTRIRIKSSATYRSRVLGDSLHATGTSRGKHERVH
jgi:hypothetical protein